MKYSPLAVHCTSLCFDVIEGRNFTHLSHVDIDGFKEDIYMLVCERTMLSPSKYRREHEFADYVASGVVCVLHQCLNNPAARDSTWILAALESRIELSIKTVLQ